MDDQGNSFFRMGENWKNYKVVEDWVTRQKFKEWDTIHNEDNKYYNYFLLDFQQSCRPSQIEWVQFVDSYVEIRISKKGTSSKEFPSPIAYLKGFPENQDTEIVEDKINDAFRKGKEIYVLHIFQYISKTQAIKNRDCIKSFFGSRNSEVAEVLSSSCCESSVNALALLYRAYNILLLEEIQPIHCTYITEKFYNYLLLDYEKVQNIWTLGPESREPIDQFYEAVLFVGLNESNKNQCHQNPNIKALIGLDKEAETEFNNRKENNYEKFIVLDFFHFITKIEAQSQKNSMILTLQDYGNNNLWNNNLQRDGQYYNQKDANILLSEAYDLLFEYYKYLKPISTGEINNQNCLQVLNATWKKDLESKKIENWINDENIKKINHEFDMRHEGFYYNYLILIYQENIYSNWIDFLNSIIYIGKGKLDNNQQRTIKHFQNAEENEKLKELLQSDKDFVLLDCFNYITENLAFTQECAMIKTAFVFKNLCNNDDGKCYYNAQNWNLQDLRLCGMHLLYRAFKKLQYEKTQLYIKPNRRQ